MSMPLLTSATLEIRACWQVLDLLTFCYQMLMLVGFLTGWALRAAVVFVLVINPIRTALGRCRRGRG